MDTGKAPIQPYGPYPSELAIIKKICKYLSVEFDQKKERDTIEEIVKTDEDEILVSCKEFSQISKEPKLKIAQFQNKTGVSYVIPDVHKPPART